MWLIVGFVLDALEALGVWGGEGSAEVGDGIGAVLKVEAVTGGVQAVDGRHAVQVVLPRLVRVEGVNSSPHTPWHVVNCATHKHPIYNTCLH